MASGGLGRHEGTVIGEGMKIVFVWEWENGLDVIARFDEGIGEVLRSFARDGHEVYVTTWGGQACGQDAGVHFMLFPPNGSPKPDKTDWVEWILEYGPDVVLSWGSIDHDLPVRLKKAGLKSPWLLFLAGGGVDHPNRQHVDHFFVETRFHQEELGEGNATIAQGVLTDILMPNPNQPKVWDALLPASFTVNKRYSLWCDVVEQGGFKGCAVGPVNDEGCVIECQKVSVPTFGYVSRKVLRDFYCASKVTVLTGGVWGGSQRALLESLACGTPVVACDDNPQLDTFHDAPVTFCPPQVNLLVEAVRHEMSDPIFSPEVLRQYVLDHWTTQHYYEAVKTNVDRIVNARRAESALA